MKEGRKGRSYKGTELSPTRFGFSTLQNDLMEDIFKQFFILFFLIAKRGDKNAFLL